MEIINLEKEIQNNRKEFKDCIIHLTNLSFYTIQDLFLNKLSFNNCTFKGDIVIDMFNNEDFTLSFHSCSFEGNVDISSSKLKRLQISFIKKIKNIEISGSEMDVLILNSNNVPIKGNIAIENCLIKESLSCNRLNIFEGGFYLNFNGEKENIDNDVKISFYGSAFDIVNFSYINFGKTVDFTKIEIKNSASFLECVFKKVFFDGSDFGKNAVFQYCTFKLDTSFKDCKNIRNTFFKISNSTFGDFPHFNNSKFNNLEIIHTTFEKKVSFDLLEVNTIKLYQVTFSQGAFFDDVKINSVENCDRKSIRTIKQEIQKAENRIDFNRFKNYEMATYYKELTWKENFVDKSILYMTKISTDFGNSWTKALVFTLLSGLVFYSIFFIAEFYLYGNCNYYFGSSYFGMFWNGFIRFLIVTDFYNPIIEDRTYIQNFWSWIPFILGKIVIAFGIYEMIQSFRKFKA